MRRRRLTIEVRARHGESLTELAGLLESTESAVRAGAKPLLRLAGPTRLVTPGPRRRLERLLS
jgi:hypothetical protein